MPAIMLRRPLAGIVALSALMPFTSVFADTAADDTVSADAVVTHYADLAITSKATTTSTNWVTKAPPLIS